MELVGYTSYINPDVKMFLFDRPAYYAQTSDFPLVPSPCCKLSVGPFLSTELRWGKNAFYFIVYQFTSYGSHQTVIQIASESNLLLAV
jgi:hypothetical protein